MINKKLNIILIILMCLLLLPISILAQSYGKTGESTYSDGDVGVPAGFSYYIDGVEMVKFSKFDATQAPGVDNDIDEGYIVGSNWYDVTNDKAYICLDNTDGAAVWAETTAEGAGETNTASNIGSEVEIFKQKTNEDLEFRTLKAGSNQITIINTTVGEKLIDEGGSTASSIGCYNTTYYGGQSWTSAASFTIGKILVTLSRTGNPTGNVTIDLYAEDGSDRPTGGILSSGSVIASTVTTDSGGELIEFAMSSYSIAATTKYVFIIKCPDGDNGNKINLRSTGTNSYADGILGRAEGGAYAPLNDHDASFIIWSADATNDFVTFDIIESEIRLDDLKAPEANTDLDATISAHGLLPKLPDDDTKVLDGTGVWVVPAGGGYTNLTEFVDQTAWKLFYSNTDGDVVELALGTNGQYLKSTGATSAPIFDVPSGGGNVLGPATSVDHSITRFDGTDNKTIQDSLATIDDSGSIDIPSGQTYKIDGTALAVGNITGAAASGANTDVTSLANISLKIGRDADNLIDFTTDNKIIFRTSAVDRMEIGSAGELDMTQNYILIDDSLGSDHDFSGLVDSATVGETVVFGDLLYYDWTDTEWKKAKADVIGTTPAMRIALESKSDGQVSLMLVMGYIRDDSAFDFGASRVFLNDDVAGTCDDTAPAETGDQVQIVGIAISADKMFFNPSIDVGEI